MASWENRSHEYYPKIGFVFQGPVDNERAARYLSDSLKKLTQFLDGANVVVSSWDESKKYLEEVRELAVVKTLPSPEVGNHVKQVMTTHLGILELIDSGITHIAKVRVDQSLDWQRILSIAPKILDVYGDERIIFLSNNSFKYRPFGLSDMFTFGSTSAMLNFWKFDESAINELNKLNFGKKFASWHNPEKMFFTESWLNLRYALKNEFKFSDSVYKDYLRYIQKFAIILDSSDYNHRWMKLESNFQGSTEKMLFNRHNPQLLAEWSFSDWFRILYDGHLEEEPKNLF